MKVLQHLTISFEFFPPKTIQGVQQLAAVATELAALNPHFFSVTFGAGGSTRDGTLETLKMLQQTTNVQIAPHLACIGTTRYEMIKILHQYKAVGVRRIVALRGDLPHDRPKPGEFNYAHELVRLISREMNDFFHIEVAAYPEIHPQAASALDDVLSLKRKFDAGANSAITQYFFNPDAYFYFLEECKKHGVDKPIVPGIMPITQYTRLAQFSDNCGAEIPRWIRKRLASYGDDLESIRAFGTEIVYNLCQRLLAGGAPGLHFYTLNKAEASIKLVELLGLALDTQQTVKAARG